MTRDRVILHSDLNSFYASVECLYNPAIKAKPVAVTGNPENRHGIILTKNQIAKSFGVKTGEAIWEAKSKCPGLICVAADYAKYTKYSEMAKEIYNDYTDQFEAFGIDEGWLDVTGSTSLFGSGKKIANEIRHRIKSELGITASIGVSFNKIFSKLGSDYEKPNATTVIDIRNYKTIAWSLPVEELLYVGRATTRKLHTLGIRTIGDLANSSLDLLTAHFGVVGVVLHRFARGEDNSPVTVNGSESYVKSVGNSLTTPRDLSSIEEVKAVFYMLSESVAARLRGHGLKCTGVQITVRDKSLRSCERQAQLPVSTFITQEIADKAVDIFLRKYKFTTPLRSIGVRGIGLVNECAHEQLNLFTDTEKRRKLELLEKSIDCLRGRYGYYSIQRGTLLEDTGLTHADIKNENTIHPVGYFKEGRML